MFQFHKGTIKTTREDLNPDIDIRFQFHKGTIKTPAIISVAFFNHVSIP